MLKCFLDRYDQICSGHLCSFRPFAGCVAWPESHFDHVGLRLSCLNHLGFDRLFWPRLESNGPISCLVPHLAHDQLYYWLSYTINEYKAFSISTMYYEVLVQNELYACRTYDYNYDKSGSVYTNEIERNCGKMLSERSQDQFISNTKCCTS